MPNKMLTLVGTITLGIGIVAATTQGCGGGSSSTLSATDACNKSCDKEASCGLLQGATADQCKALVCAGIGSGGSSGSQDTCGMTQDAIAAKFNDCLAKSCDTFMACVEAICPQGSGAGGSTGSGGTHATGSAGTSGGAGTSGTAGSTGAGGFTFTGTAGTAGSTCSTACAKADTCCVALGANGGGQCDLASQCADAGASMSTAVNACNAYLQATAFLGASQPAACK